MIQFQSNGSQYEGYLARPSVPGPGVIVIQEWWGLVGHIKSVADRLAADGFNALAPDFYQGKATTEPDEAGSLMMALDIANAEKILNGAIEALLADPMTKGGKVGVVGFCMGGQLSLYAASINPKIGACVDYYGIHPNVHPRFAELQAPVLGFFAENDDYAGPSQVAALAATLAQHGKDHEFTTFPGTRHAFFNDDRSEVYDPEAAKQSYDRMIAFFREHL